MEIILILSIMVLRLPILIIKLLQMEYLLHFLEHITHISYNYKDSIMVKIFILETKMEITVRGMLGDL